MRIRLSSSATRESGYGIGEGVSVRSARPLFPIPNPQSRITLLVVLLAFLAFLAVSVVAQTPDRTAPPKLGPPPSLKLPAIQRFEMSNGMKVILLEKNALPLVQFTFVFNAGSVNDKPDRLGVASMTAAMMDEGAGSRTSLQIAEEVEFFGASVGVGADLHTSFVSLFTPTSKLDDVMPIVADVVLRPTFPEGELNRLRKERLTALLQSHDQPRAIASVAFRQLVYGTEHPYGRTPTGSESSLKTMTVKDLKEFHATYYRPNNVTVIVVGDVTRERVRKSLDQWFGSWDPSRVPTVVVPPAPQVGPRTVYLVDKPEAPQSEIRIGRVGLPRKSEEYFAATVLNTVLGGSFSSRLNQNLRETHGYTYGAGSSFDFRPSPGPFLAASAVKTDVTDEALTEFMKELNAILQPVPEDELARAKNYVALGYPGDFQTARQIAGKLAEMVVYDLPPNYFNTYIDRVLGVKSSDVSRTGRSTIDPEKLVIVVVGDRSAIEKDVTALGLGPVKNLTIEEVLGKKPVVE